VFEGQPDIEGMRALFAADRVEIALCAFFDFADEPLRLCTRTIPFVDNENGDTWASGSGLLIGLPSVDFSDNSLAPEREFNLGISESSALADDWRKVLTDAVDDFANYQGRAYSLQLQVFSGGQPFGYPIYIDRGKMSRQSLKFGPDISMISLMCEAGATRFNVPSGLYLTGPDQKSLYPTDEGLDFTTESGKLVIWTKF
tara:strand:- start:3668 stop:4267 length:600 start_codon:yes stop_codon:yes gene_type:complete